MKIIVVAFLLLFLNISEAAVYRYESGGVSVSVEVPGNTSVTINGVPVQPMSPAQKSIQNADDVVNVPSRRVSEAPTPVPSVMAVPAPMAPTPAPSPVSAPSLQHDPAVAAPREKGEQEKVTASLKKIMLAVSAALHAKGVKLAQAMDLNRQTVILYGMICLMLLGSIFLLTFRRLFNPYVVGVMTKGELFASRVSAATVLAMQHVVSGATSIFERTAEHWRDLKEGADSDPVRNEEEVERYRKKTERYFFRRRLKKGLFILVLLLIVIAIAIFIGSYGHMFKRIVR